MRFSIDIKEMGEIEFQKKLQRALVKVAYDMEAEAKKLCPVDMGRLRNSITTKITGNKIILGAGTKYAPYVEFGTAPHEIKPKTKKALAFEYTPAIGGRKERLKAGIPKSKAGKMIVKKVMHPGTEPQPFIRPALHKGAHIFLEKRLREEFGG